MKKIYEKKIDQVIPRILSFYDKNFLSKNYGSGDRLRWAWGLTDFANATYLCSVFGFSCLIKNNYFKKNTEHIINLINTIFINIKNIANSNKGFNESFPNEHSYCVTALVADSAIGALDNIKKFIPKNKVKEYETICENVIDILDNLEENHAFINNHLSTAALAYCRYWKLTKIQKYKIKFTSILDKIYKNQSNEGWYKEYNGFDPGYETLSINYLAQILKIYPNKKLNKSILNSLNFLKFFIHKDLSFGGIYGSRCTEFIFPGGLETFNILNKNDFPIEKIRKSIKFDKHPNLLSIDDMNLIPMFNSYCLAINNFKLSTKIKNKEFYINNYFSDSGIYLKNNRNFQLIINVKKGGCFYFFRKNENIKNYGVVLKNKNNFVSNQKYDDNNTIEIIKDTIKIKSQFKKINYKSISELEFFFLRFLCLTFFKIKFFREYFKIYAANKLIFENMNVEAFNIRTFKLNSKNIRTKDRIESDKNFQEVKNKNFFNHIHMASQGYWHKF